ITSAVTHSTENAYPTANILRDTGTMYFGSNIVDGVTLYPFRGKLYFIAIYDSVISKATNEAILAGTTQPYDLSPVFYIDFSQNVAATYTSEIGDKTLTVTGTPVKGP
ncbi:MAG: hypothetical protein KAH23_04455, partial [Kiritimatiellae bacterium]|nr:hypothetical protein [Kiritimatiellia bacterium]